MNAPNLWHASTASNPCTSSPTNPDLARAPGFPLTPTTLKAYLMTPIELKQWQADLHLSDVAMSAYLGVPVPTLTKWLNGTRAPDSATLRLFGILQRIGRAYPVLHGELMQEARAAAPDVPRRPRGRPSKASAPASQENAPHGPLEAQTTVSEIPGWLTGAI